MDVDVESGEEVGKENEDEMDVVVGGWREWVRLARWGGMGGRVVVLVVSTLSD